MMGRLLWYAALLGIAFVTIAVQFDRQSAVDPRFADFTPAPFRGFAQAQVAARALKADMPDLAVAEARRLVDRRPIPGEALALLAQAQIAQGNLDQGLITIQYAARRGWRDPAAQEAMLRLAAAAGDEAEAARRYVALLITPGFDDTRLSALGELVFADSDGTARETLVGIVEGADRWRSVYLRRGPTVLSPDVFTAITTEAARRGVVYECRPLEQAQRTLEKTAPDAAAAISELVDQNCP